jgi:hypothetical protein
MPITPGPWHAETAPCGTRIGLMAELTQQAVAMLGMKAALNPDDVRLIESAPDLLAACQEVLAWAEHSGAFCEREDREVLAQVKAAVAKAARQ